MLTELERLKYCRFCLNRKFDPKRGIVCSITNDKPTFEINCENYQKDSIAIAKDIVFEEEHEKRKLPLNDLTFGLEKIGIKNGILAGILLIAFGLTWLIVGLKYALVFWYPLVLIIMGIIALIIGIINKSAVLIKNKKKHNSVFDDVIDN